MEAEPEVLVVLADKAVLVDKAVTVHTLHMLVMALCICHSRLEELIETLNHGT